MEIQCGYVKTEGDELFYKVRGNGEPILFIAPGGGDGDNYLRVADILAKKYKVITYDRRANGRSTRNFPNDFSIQQQARDAMAILKEVGEESCVVIGNSSGAVIALDMAASFPEAVKAAVIHEAPLPSVLPDHEKWKKFFEGCHSLGMKWGSSLGATKFIFGIDMPVMALMKASKEGSKYSKNEQTIYDGNRMSSKDSSDVLIKNELLPVTAYHPDFDALTRSGVKFFVGCGQYGLSKYTWYAEVAGTLAIKLNSSLVEFPGHHASFMDEPIEWSNTLLRLFDEC